MATIKRGALPADNFTQIDNRWLRDKRLSWKARGLLAWLSSHTAEFQVSLDRIVKASDKDGREATRTAIQELEKAGYLIREKDRDSRGRIVSSSYTLVDPSIVGNPNVGEPDPLRTPSSSEDHSFIAAAQDRSSGSLDMPISSGLRDRQIQTVRSVTREALDTDALVDEMEGDFEALGYLANNNWFGDTTEFVEAAVAELREDSAIKDADAWLAATLKNLSPVGKAHRLMKIVGDGDDE